MTDLVVSSSCKALEDLESRSSRGYLRAVKKMASTMKTEAIVVWDIENNRVPSQLVPRCFEIVQWLLQVNTQSTGVLTADQKQLCTNPLQRCPHNTTQLIISRKQQMLHPQELAAGGFCRKFRNRAPTPQSCEYTWQGHLTSTLRS